MDTSRSMRAFPIDRSLGALCSALGRSTRVVLAAPPGAGKTTRVPLTLLHETWQAGKKIIMLEPRRLAAIRAAQFMASMLNEKVGETVGYRIRGDTVIGPSTILEVVTEGVLTRLLQSTPDLPDVGLVIFDEFHERSIHADLGLGLTLEAQEHLRPELRILVMSATLDGVGVARMMGNAEVVESPGQSYPVETCYRDFPVEGPIEQAIAQTTQNALEACEGDILVFLPGQREIRRVENLLGDARLSEIDIQTLYGDAPAARQRAALQPASSGRRKIILATSIAETSLTIEGVRVVVDSGLARSARFDPRRGMSGLVTIPESQANADQRRGRAGREAPGFCYRLWTEQQHSALPAFPVPEILVTDLAPLVLDCALWGVADLTRLRLLDLPPAAHVQQATSLLHNLGALDAEGKPTRHGREMAGIPVHPRLSHMILRGLERGWGETACDIAALLEDRDILRERGPSDIDFVLRLHALANRADADPGIRERVLREARRLRRLVGVSERKADEQKAGILLAIAYPERVARRRPDNGGRYLLANGTGAIVAESSSLIREDCLAIADVDGTATHVKIYLASPVNKADLLDVFAEDVVIREDVAWNENQEAVVARKVHRLGALVLEEQFETPRSDAVRTALFDGIQKMGLDVLPWNSSCREFQARSEWLRVHRHVAADWPELSDHRLMETLPEWLGPFVGGITRRKQLERIDLAGALKSQFSSRQLSDLDHLAPAWILVPSGSRLRLTYSTNPEPVLAVRLQELFGQTSTPTIAGGRVAVVLHLLSPAARPLAVTKDLKSFWEQTYPVIRTQMRARYRKHQWPDDPMQAAPTRRTKRRQEKL